MKKKNYSNRKPKKLLNRKKKTLKGGVRRSSIASGLGGILNTANNVVNSAVGVANEAVKVVKDGAVEVVKEGVNSLKENLEKFTLGEDLMKIFIDHSPICSSFSSIDILRKIEGTPNISLFLKNKYHIMGSFNAKEIVSALILNEFEQVANTSSKIGKIKLALNMTKLTYNFELLTTIPALKNKNKLILNIIKVNKEQKPEIERWYPMLDEQTIKKEQINEYFNEVKVDLGIFNNGQVDDEESFSYRKNIIKYNDEEQKKMSLFYVFRIEEKKKMIIAIRGTQTLTDVSIDLNATSKVIPIDKKYYNQLDDPIKSVYFHSGFLESALKIFEVIKEHLEKSSDDGIEKILICGHSMGGAESGILGLIIASFNNLPQQIKKIKIATFNPGTYIIKDENYNKMVKQLKTEKSLNLRNLIYISPGDLISSCNLKNIYKTFKILLTDDINESNLLDKFKDEMQSTSTATSKTYKIITIPAIKDYFTSGDESKLPTNYNVDRTEQQVEFEMEAAEFEAKKELFDEQPIPGREQIFRIDSILEKTLGNDYGINMNTELLELEKTDIKTLIYEDGQPKFYYGMIQVPFTITGMSSISTHSLSNFEPILTGDYPKDSPKTDGDTPEGGIFQSFKDQLMNYSLENTLSYAQNLKNSINQLNNSDKQLFCDIFMSKFSILINKIKRISTLKLMFPSIDELDKLFNEKKSVLSQDDLPEKLKSDIGFTKILSFTGGKKNFRLRLNSKKKKNKYIHKQLKRTKNNYILKSVSLSGGQPGESLSNDEINGKINLIVTCFRLSPRLCLIILFLINPNMIISILK